MPVLRWWNNEAPEHRDEISKDGFNSMSNNAGGVLGGISTGQDLVASISLKPTSSLTTPGRSIDAAGDEVEVVTKGRHDPCVGIRAVPIAEAMMALVVMDHLMRQRAQNPGWLGRPERVGAACRRAKRVGKPRQRWRSQR